MANIWDSIKSAADAVGGAVTAPAAAVVDLAQMGFDDKDDDFGSVLATASKTVQTMGMNPFLQLGGEDVSVGDMASGVLKGANWLLDMGINRPISTLSTMASHQEAVTADLNRSTPQGWFDSGLAAARVWASGDDWATAWRQSDEMNAGQALANMLVYDNSVDPFSYENMYDEKTAQEHPYQAAGISWTANIAGALTLDPTGVALKGAGLAVQSVKFAKLSAAERANFFENVTGGSASLTSRTDSYLDYINGANSQNRALSAPEILAVTPELNRYGTNPHVLAGLLADAQKIDTPAASRDAQRRILAVAMGDRSQIARLEAEKIGPAEITDALKNYTKGSVLDLTTTSLRPGLKENPAFVQHLESQVQNLNSGGSVQKFVDDWNSRVDLKLGIDSTLVNAPGRHAQGARALARENGQSLAQTVSAKHTAVDAWAARVAKAGASRSSVFQKSAAHVPLVVMRTAGTPMKVYTKAPAAASAALRQAHFTGVVNLDEWGRASTELDSMMRLTNVADETRRSMLNRVFLARDESEKMKLIEEIEHVSLLGLADEFAVKAKGVTDEVIDPDLIRAVMEKSNLSRTGKLSAMRGRAYATTAQSPERQAVLNDVMRANTARRAEDSTAAAFNRPTPDRTWRVDEVLDDSGMPVHLPLLETQLANKVPLIDVHLARKTMGREFGTMGRLSKTWKRDAAEYERLWRLKQSGAQGLDNAIRARAAAMDWTVDMAQSALRVWKFSVLFRLGYPIRVLMDEEARIWARLGSTGFMSHVGARSGEALSNTANNVVGRRVRAERAMRQLQYERTELNVMLEDDLVEAWHARNADLVKVRRSVGGIRGQIARWESAAQAGDTTALDKADKARQKLAAREAYMQRLEENLGESPDALLARRNAIDEALQAGAKGQMEPKRLLGQSDITVDDVTFPGAFGGQYGGVTRDAASSSSTFDAQLRGIEDASVRKMTGGTYRVIEPSEPGYADAWADVLNHQIHNSPAAMFFLKGGDVDGFAAWVRAPEQAELRRRLPHFAHDPEDWGNRIESMLLDYIPNGQVAEAVAKGRVTPRQLMRMTDNLERPAVHGTAAGDTLGSNQGTRMIGNALNNVMRYLSEVPTDRLSRHPFFVSMYRTHVEDAMAVRKAGGQTMFTQANVDDIAHVARQRAMKDVRNTLFDLSAHSHAAHVMRFVSPFFAAHQESLMRWYRLGAEDPSVVRKIGLAFDAPRYAGIVIDSETGEPVEPGSLPSPSHKILLQLPGKDVTEEQAQWSISESAFNLLMPQGPTNPGLGPLVQVPLDFFAKKYADEPDIARVATVFNPYPPQGTFDSLVPATAKRLLATSAANGGPDLAGIGQQEYNSALSQEVQDMVVDFQLKYGREPLNAERDQIVEDAANEAATRMWHRALWNGLSPAPATPQSRYAAVQQGWYQIQEQARAEGQDFDWAYERFKEKYQEAYLPLIASSAKNPAGVLTPNSAWVEAIKTYSPTLQNVDPALTRAVVGGYAAEIEAEDPDYAEYNQVARNWFRDTQIREGVDENYYSYADPRTAMEDAQVARGWSKYNSITAALENAAEQRGLASYEDDAQLVAIKKAAVAQLEAENDAWAADYGMVDSTKFDRYLTDLQQMVDTPALAQDPTRTDIATLAQYLAVRQRFTDYFEQSLAAGTGGVDAASNLQVRQMYTALVDQMVRSDTQFQAYMYDGLIERDPYLVRDE